MLLRLLCDSKYLVSDTLCTAMSSVVLNALEKGDSKVQSEVRLKQKYAYKFYAYKYYAYKYYAYKYRVR